MQRQLLQESPPLEIQEVRCGGSGASYHVAAAAPAAAVKPAAAAFEAAEAAAEDQATARDQRHHRAADDDADAHEAARGTHIAFGTTLGPL